MLKELPNQEEGVAKGEARSVGLPRRAFRKIAANGLGEALNSYPHSFAWHDGHLYVGTTRANLANRAKQVQKTAPERMGEIWPVPIPRSQFDNDLRAQIWRYHFPSDTWEKLYTSSTVIGHDGFEVPISIGFRCMASYQGPGDPKPALYVPCWGTHQTGEAIMLRSRDGVHFEETAPVDAGMPDYKPRNIRGLIAFNGWLFASPAVGQKRDEPNIAETMVIFCSQDPAGGAWELACEPHFGNPNNLTVFQMAVFDGHLYAGTLNINEGCEIWKTKAEGKPPFKWKKVLGGGAFRGKLNQIAMTLTPFKGQLYVGTAIQNCSFDFSNGVGPAPPEILRVNPDDTWELVVGDPRLTSEGLKVPLSGLTSGFGNPFSGYLWSMCAHDGWLYAGTAVWLVFLRYSGQYERLPPMLHRMLSAKNLEELLRDYGGCDLWRTSDGHRWVPVTINGFDNCYNIGFRNMASSPYGLFVGAANPFAPLVATKRVGGWRYESNPEGGLEIWLGSDPARAADARARESIAPAVPALPAGRPVPLAELADELYGGSGFRHVGFWRLGMRDARAACENLMGEVLAFAPRDEGTRVLEIGCGSGATTRCLLRDYPADAITAVTTDRKQLRACRARALGVRFLHRKASNLRLPPRSFDLVLWVLGPEPLGDRQRLLRQAFDLLAPHGRLVCFEGMRAARPTSGSRWKTRRTEPTTAGEYRDLLLATGFVEPSVHDVTAHTVKEFDKHLAGFVALRKLSNDQRDLTVEALQFHLFGDLALTGCLLVSATKPDPARRDPPARIVTGEPS
jgi:SAM-dependent methyltransferase